MTINCELCGEAIHSVKRHLGENHPEMTVEEYQEKFPNAPLLSEAAKERIREIKEKRAAEAGKSDMVRSLVAHEPLKTERKPLHEVFQIPKTTPGVLSKVGSRPIPVAVYDQAPKGFEDFIPEIDSRYIFNVDSLKTVLMGFEMRINAYLSGHAGVGKSTLFEQACAFTRRAMMRIQHTVNT
ncbi:MAG: hypothetical protein KI788_02415, partial [Mameliella sp.]|nr:hypothetical protein [Mameliella sp.]